MARTFPFIDVLIGTPASPVAGVPALLTQGTVIELFADLACTTPLTTATDTGGTPITSVKIVDGVRIPAFIVTSDAVTVVYGRPTGVTGNGFPMRPIPSTIVLNAADSVPAGTPAGTIIMRRT